MVTFAYSTLLLKPVSHLEVLCDPQTEGTIAEKKYFHYVLGLANCYHTDRFLEVACQGLNLPTLAFYTKK